MFCFIHSGRECFGVEFLDILKPAKKNRQDKSEKKKSPRNMPKS